MKRILRRRRNTVRATPPPIKVRPVSAMLVAATPVSGRLPVPPAPPPVEPPGDNGLSDGLPGPPGPPGTPGTPGPSEPAGMDGVGAGDSDEAHGSSQKTLCF